MIGGDKLNNDGLIKGKLDSNLYEAFKKVISKTGITYQEFIEVSVKKYIIDNLNILLEKESK